MAPNKHFVATAATGFRLHRFTLSGTIFALMWTLVHTGANAHTLPYFSWFHVERQATAGLNEIRISHTCRFDPLSFRADDPLVDSDGDSTASQHELADLCALTARYLAQDFLALGLNQPLPASLDSFAMLENGAGFRTEMVVPLPLSEKRLPVSLLDPAFLMPRPVPSPSDAETSQSLACVTEDGVLLLNPAGHPVHSIPLAPAFRTDFTIERAEISPAGPDVSASILSQFPSDEQSNKRTPEVLP